MKRYIFILICLCISVYLYPAKNENIEINNAKNITKTNTIKRFTIENSKTKLFSADKTYKVLFWSGFFYSFLNPLNSILTSIPSFLVGNPNGTSPVINLQCFLSVFVPLIFNILSSPIPYAGPLIVSSYNIISSIAFLIAFNRGGNDTDMIGLRIFTPLFITGILEIGAIILEFLSLRYKFKNKKNNVSLIISPNILEYKKFELLMGINLKL